MDSSPVLGLLRANQVRGYCTPTRTPDLFLFVFLSCPLCVPSQLQYERFWTF
jgi:hypothetical protein